MRYEVISADSHLDLVWLPEALFVSEAPSRLKDRMPKVVKTGEGRIWVADGIKLGSGAAALLIGSYEPYTPGRSHALDRMDTRGFFSDAQRGLLHPSNPELRMADQDADGIRTEVIYGILGIGAGFSDAEGGISDPEVLMAVYDIYNRWIADFCTSNPARLAGLATISCHDPEVSAQQLKQAARLGLGGAEFNVEIAAKPIYQKDWDILWATAADCHMPISFHTTGLPFRQPDQECRDEYEVVTLGLITPYFSYRGLSSWLASFSPGPVIAIQTLISCWGNAASAGFPMFSSGSTMSTRTACST